MLSVMLIGCRRGVDVAVDGDEVIIVFDDGHVISVSVVIEVAVVVGVDVNGGVVDAPVAKIVLMRLFMMVLAVRVMLITASIIGRRQGLFLKVMLGDRAKRTLEVLCIRHNGISRRKDSRLPKLSLTVHQFTLPFAD